MHISVSGNNTTAFVFSVGQFAAIDIHIHAAGENHYPFDESPDSADTAGDQCDEYLQDPHAGKTEIETVDAPAAEK